METETLCNYEQNLEKHIDNNMDVDIAMNEGENTSSDNKTYSDNIDEQNKEDKTEDNESDDDSTRRIEMESDDECEEEEKLILSPAHSDKVYDSDDGAPLSPVLNRDELDSDNEPEKESNKLNDNAEENESNKSHDEAVEEFNKSNDDAEESNKSNEDAAEECNKVDDDATEVLNKSNDDAEEVINKSNDDSAEASNKSNDDAAEVVDIPDNADEKKVLDDMPDDCDAANKIESEEQSDKLIENESQDNQTNQTEDEPEKDDKEQKKICDDKEHDKEISIESNKDEDKSKPEETIEVEDNESAENDSKETEVVNIDQSSNDEETKDDAESTVKNSTSKSKSKNKKKGSKQNKGKSTEKDNVDHTNEENKTETVDDPYKGSLLKETLTKTANDDKPDESKEAEGDAEMDMDEDFDPSLLCPELLMEVDEQPVITSSDLPAPDQDGSKSPLRLYDPIFSTFVDEMTGAEVDFNLTAEEIELKLQTYGSKNPIQYTKIHCTACNVHLGSKLDGQGNRFVHPLLKVLICKKCYHFYTSGEFEKDEDGSELYCRWCGQGGQVLCCSDCEMVFCKKCIRINFDRKKLAAIQRSDDWKCFRCNPSQLIHLRIHCAEFMEYIQREIRLAGSSGNVDTFMNTDYCQCCIPQKKKAPEPSPSSEPRSKKRRRLNSDEDPDYNPLADTERSELNTSTIPQRPLLTSAACGLQQPKLSQSPTVVPKAPMVKPTMPVQIRPKGTAIQYPAPRTTQTFVRPTINRATIPTASVNSVRPPPLRHVGPMATTTTQPAKHEWFEKTVRAAARVNSNLSYTLTQLNRAQANATSVEALAVVHNKLQEILSSSINSLIQIRKNLRTEFIAGIKTLRFPPKVPPPSQPTMSKDDDDVIFVVSDPPPPPLVAVSTTNANKIALPPSVTLVRKPTPAKSLITPTKSSTIPAKTSNTPSRVLPTSINNVSLTMRPGPSGINSNTPSTSKTTSDDIRPKGFLRVKSFSALQNVTSECITIPDDPPEDPDVEIIKEVDPLAQPDKAEEEPEPVESVKNEEDEKESKKSEEIEEIVEPEKLTESNKVNGIANGESENSMEGIDSEIPTTVNTVTDKWALDLLKPARIILKRSSEIDNLAKSKLMNGDTEEEVDVVNV